VVSTLRKWARGLAGRKTFDDVLGELDGELALLAKKGIEKPVDVFLRVDQVRTEAGQIFITLEFRIRGGAKRAS